MKDLKNFINEFPELSQTESHPVYHLSKAGRHCIHKGKKQLSDVVKFMGVPDKLLLVGIFSQITANDFEALVQQNKQEQINKIVKKGVVLGINSLIYNAALREENSSFKKFYDKIRSNRPRRNPSTALNCFLEEITDEEKTEHIDFTFLQSQGKYTGATPQQVRKTTSLDRPMTAKSTAKMNKPNPVNLETVFQSLIYDIILFVTVFMLILIISFVFGALNSQVTEIVKNPFFSFLCVLTSSTLIILFGGFKTFNNSNNQPID